MLELGKQVGGDLITMDDTKILVRKILSSEKKERKEDS